MKSTLLPDSNIPFDSICYVCKCIHPVELQRNYIRQTSFLYSLQNVKKNENQKTLLNNDKNEWRHRKPKQPKEKKYISHTTDIEIKIKIQNLNINNLNIFKHLYKPIKN